MEKNPNLSDRQSVQTSNNKYRIDFSYWKQTEVDFAVARLEQK